jgi:oligo-1,6-glucosidase
VSRYGTAGPLRETSAKAIATVLHLHRGTPFIYQGEELGMTNAAFKSITDYRDIESLNHYEHAIAAGQDAQRVLASLAAMSRDHARTPMQWDATAHGAFTAGTPWIGANPNFRDINAAAALADPNSVLHHYRRLIALRHNEPAVVHGDFILLLPDDPHLWVFLRRHQHTTLLTAANFSDRARPVPLPDPSTWQNAELLISNYKPASNQHDQLLLRPWETRVYRRSIDVHEPATRRSSRTGREP